MGDDFGPLSSTPLLQNDATQNIAKADANRKREWLKVFETLPPQMLNAYGAGKYPKLSDAGVWEAFNQPQKTGAIYMTELCSQQVERRGVGINRMLHALKTFCEHQLEESVRGQNQALLKESMFEEIYAEIGSILPSLEYCLAPKKHLRRRDRPLCGHLLCRRQRNQPRAIRSWTSMQLSFSHGWTLANRHAFVCCFIGRAPLDYLLLLQCITVLRNVSGTTAT